MIALLAVLSALAGTTDDAPTPTQTPMSTTTAPEPAAVTAPTPVVEPISSVPTLEAKETSANAPSQPRSESPRSVSTVPPKQPTTATAPRPEGKLVKRSIAATQWPLEPALSAGFLWSNVAIVPYLGLTTFVPVIPGVGPTVVLRGGAANTGVATYLEGIFGLGVGFEGRLGDLRARASFVPSVQLSSVDPGSGAATNLGPAVLVPLELALPLGSGVSFTGSIEPGIAAPVKVAVGNEVVTGRDRFFVLLGAGVTFGGPVD